MPISWSRGSKIVEGSAGRLLCPPIVYSNYIHYTLCLARLVMEGRGDPKPTKKINALFSAEYTYRKKGRKTSNEKSRQKRGGGGGGSEIPSFLLFSGKTRGGSKKRALLRFLLLQSLQYEQPSGKKRTPSVRRIILQQQRSTYIYTQHCVSGRVKK